MRKSSKLIAVAGVLAVTASAALAGTASAAAPDGTYTVAPKANANASEVGKQSSQITQNGQFVSGKFTGLDGWQNQRGDRSEIVQATLGH